MKKITKLLAVMTALALAFAFAACSKEEPAEEPEPEVGQNPIMDFIGTYACERATIEVTATDDIDGAAATVTWGASAAEQAEWTMSGTYDADSHVFTYSDCVKKDVVYNEGGTVDSEEVLYSDGTGTMTFSEGTEGPYLEWKDDKENAADGMTFTFVKNEVGMANPWSDVDSAEAAAEGAGFDEFVIPVGEELSLGAIDSEHIQYRCMEGMADAVIGYPAAEVTVRKGTTEFEMAEGDISGDYSEYKLDWTVSVGDIEVKCFGNREGEAMKTIWHTGDYDYAVLAEGLGGDDDFGLKADDIPVLVNGTK